MSEAIIRIIYDNLPTVEVLRHQEDARGDIFTLQKKITWRGLVVHEGFESDGASVPRILWPVVFPNDDLQSMFAAIVHDFIYRKHPAGWTRKEADDALY